MNKRRLLSFATVWIGQWLLATAGSAQVIHTSHDHIPDFSANPTVTTAANGGWSTPSTWSPARVPGPSDVVRIRHAVTFDTTAGDVSVVGVDAGGALRFATNQATILRVGTLMVLQGGTLEVGTTSSPIAATASSEIVIKDRALNLSVDPDQYGTGLLVVNGTVRIHGAVKAPTWTRLAAEPRAGQSTLTLDQPATGWRVNDRLVVPDSREDPTRNTDAQLEQRTVAAISADGRTITLSAPLTYTHPGARDYNRNLVLLPHVMNLTRNVVIRSENPSGTRGHTLYTHRANVDVRYAEYRDLGRTTISPLDPAANHIGRYALHLHHLLGPIAGQTPANGYQFTVIGNAMLDTNVARSRIKWPLAIHNSHYGLVQDNAVYNAGGAGLVTEDGNESYNVIDRNFVVRVQGEGDRQGNKSNGAREAGSQGIGLWFHGVNNYVRNNVGANARENTDEAAYGLEIYQEFVGDLRIPNFKGADPQVAGEYTLRSAYTIPILEFSGNESYGNPQGMTYWWVGMEYHTVRATAQNVFRNTRIWHVSRYPLYAYHGAKITFDGLEIYGDTANLSGFCCRRAWFGDYLNVDTTIRRATIVGINALTLPYAAGGTTRVEDSFIAARSGIVNTTSGAPGDCRGCNLPDRVQVISNVRFGALPGYALSTIVMEYNTHGGAADFDSKDEMFVVNYQGQAGNDFRVYYREQASQNIAGGLAPCNDTRTRPEIYGITCPMTGSPPAPAPPPPSPAPAAPTNLRIVSQ